MKISVIVPNYNHAKFLQQRLDSVLNQSFENVEVVILDDGSIDESRVVIEQYRNHPRVSAIIYNEQNSGSPFRQWQKGIEATTGDWIWIAESDDYAHQDLLLELTKQATKHENTVLAYCQSVEVDAQSQGNETMLWWVKDLDPVRWTADYVNDGSHEVANYLLYKNTIPNASAVLFKKKSYLAVSDQYTNLRLCGDWLFWVQLLRTGGLAYSAKPLNFFRQHRDTTRGLFAGEKLRNRLEEEYRVFRYIKRNIPAATPQHLSRRLKQLVFQYRESYTRQEMLRFIFLPFLYRGKLPLRWLVTDYAKTIFAKLLNKRAAQRRLASV